MLAEVLLVLAGHPSSFFIPSPAAPVRSKTLVVSSELQTYLHPGEVTTLNSLAHLAWQYTSIRSWATDIQRRGRDAIYRSSTKGKGKQRAETTDDTAPGQYLSTLASSILESLKEWDLLLVDIEAKILTLDEGWVQDPMGHVPLSTLLAALSPWQAPLAALSHLVQQLQTPPPPGRLLDLVRATADHGNPKIHEMFSKLSDNLETLFLTHLTLFVLDGFAPTASTPTSPALGIDAGSDPLSPQHRSYKLNDDLLPSNIDQRMKESLLYVGRVAATLRREGRNLPKAMTDDVREEIMGSVGRGDDALANAVSRARAEVGEWLWKNVLTGPQILDTLDSFGNYFLTRNADLTLSLIREIRRLQLDKLITSDPKSSSSVIKEQDLDLALLRASVGTSAENDPALDRLRFRFERGPIRPILASLSPSKLRRPDTSQTTDNPYKAEKSIRDLFSSFILGSPISLTTQITWPLDLFMTPPALATYSDIHSYLFALRDTHLRVQDCWSSLSAAQRRRRKWTGTTEGGTDDEVEGRQALARSAWGTVRAMLFFFDTMVGHFMTDIVEVQHRNLMEQLEGVESRGTASAPNSIRGSTRSLGVKPNSPSTRLRPSSRQSDRPGSPVATSVVEGSTVRSRGAPPTPHKPQTKYLDFLTLRQIHSRHLAFLREGLLLADKGIALVIRDLLEVCVRLTGLVDRWGGDVVPELLAEGSNGEDVGDLVRERSTTVSEVNEELHELLTIFFRALLDTQSPPSNADASTSNGASMSRTARAAQMIQSTRIASRQISFSKSFLASKTGFAKANNTVVGRGKVTEKEERSAEVEALMAKHVEQLLLRLDFNGVLSTWMDEDVKVNNTAVLAEGGL